MRAAVLLLLLGCANDPVVVVRSPEGVRRARYHVEVARTSSERMAGLRGVDSLAADEGLWIEFPVEDELCIVNSGVSFGIDVAWVRAGRVVAVESFGADEPDPQCFIASEVLEVAAGSPVQIGDSASLR